MEVKKILENLLELLAKENSEKEMQKKTDVIIDFFIFTVPKAIGKAVVEAFSETYSWMSDGVKLIRDAYREWHDVRKFTKMYIQRDKYKVSFCKRDYKNGEVICKYSKGFYDKSFMTHFCREQGCNPNLEVIVKKHSIPEHKGYCICSYVSSKKKL